MCWLPVRTHNVCSPTRAIPNRDNDSSSRKNLDLSIGMLVKGKLFGRLNNNNIPCTGQIGEESVGSASTPKPNPHD